MSNLGDRIERTGNCAVRIVMSLAAVFIVLGLACGWI